MTWLAIKLFFGGMLKRLWEAAGAVLVWARRNPSQALIGVLCGILAVGYWHYSGKVSDLKEQVASKQATIEKMKAASKQAGKDQAIVNERPQIISRQIAEASNVQSKSYYEEGRRAGIAYADTHRVREGTGQCLLGNSGLPEADRVDQGHDGPRSPPDLVAVSQADYNLLVSNSLRLAQVHADASAMISTGIAVGE